MTIGMGPHLRLVKLGVLAHWCPACDRPHLVNLSHHGNAWDHNGSSPTFTPDIRHVDGLGICHYFITAGQVKFLADSTHIHAGKVMSLPIYPHRRA